MGRAGLRLSCTGVRSTNDKHQTMSQYTRLIKVIKGESKEFTALAHLAGEPLISWLKDNFDKDEPADLTVDVPHDFLEELSSVAGEPDHFNEMLCDLGIRNAAFVDKWFEDYRHEWKRRTQDVAETQEEQDILRWRRS